MTDSKLVIQVESTGSARVAGEIGKVTQAVKQNTEAVAQQAQKAKVAGVEIDKFGSTLGIAGQAVGRLNQTAGSMVTTLGAATGAVQSLTTVGLGPLGIAVTAVNLAITAGIPLLQSMSKEHDLAARAADRQAESLGSVIARMRQVREEQQTTARLRRGEGSSEEFEGVIEQLRNQQREQIAAGNSQGADALNQTIRINQQYARQAREREAAERNDAALRAQMEADRQQVAAMIAQAGGAAQPRRGGGGRAAPSGPSLEDLMGRMGSRSPFASDAAAFDEMLRQNEERAAQEAQAAVDAQKARDALVYEERMAAEQKITDLLAEQEAERARIAQEADAARIESFQQTASMVQAIGSSLQQVYGFVDDASAKSDMSAEERQKRELKRMAFVQSVEAIINAANAAAAYARLDIPAGVSYTVASTLNAAAAAKAGIDAGNVRASTSGGASGSAMRRDSQARSMSSEPTTVVVNMNGPVVAATDRAELGRQLGRIVDEGRARYGS